jgi:hypothetical protein
MSKNLWIPLLGAVFFQGIGTLMILTVPETLPMAIAQEADVSDSSPIVSEGPEANNQPPILERWKNWVRQTISSFSFVTRDAAVVPLVLTFLISKVGRQSTNVLFQYVSKRYRWSLSQVRI